MCYGPRATAGTLELNLATTVSFCAAATSTSFAVLAAYLGRVAPTRHFRHASVAAFAGAFYCLTDAVIAGRSGREPTLFAGHVGGFAMSVHSAAWLAFLAAWARRRRSRTEQALYVANIVAALLCLAPGLVVAPEIRERTVRSLGIIYRDPSFGWLGVACVIVAYAAHVVAALAAFRMRAQTPRALAVAGGLASFCVVVPIDLLSALHVLNLPYFADLAIACSVFSIGAVVVVDAADSADKSMQLEDARLALAERDNLAALGQLAAVVAHEVRNPVTIIFSALATLRKSARSEQDGSLLSIVDEEARRLQQLVTRLLDVVRPFELQYTVVGVDRLLALAIAQGTSGTSAGVQLEVTEEVDVECDELLFVQAVSNLVQNAVLASGRRSPVRVRARVEDERSPAMLRIEVTDDGDGVRPEARARLFTPFFTTRATGTGLGLALVKRIAGAHGGTVEHEIPQGGGACFVFRVPLQASEARPRRLIGNELS